MQRKALFEQALGAAGTREMDLDRHADHLPSHRGRRLRGNGRLLNYGHYSTYYLPSIFYCCVAAFINII